MTDISKEAVKRFKLVRSDPGYSDQMCVRPDGNYVRHADYAALRAELDRSEARVAELEGANSALGDLLAYEEWRAHEGGVVPDRFVGVLNRAISAHRAALADERKEGV